MTYHISMPEIAVASVENGYVVTWRVVSPTGVDNRCKVALDGPALLAVISEAENMVRHQVAEARKREAIANAKSILTTAGFKLEEPKVPKA